MQFTVTFDVINDNRVRALVNCTSVGIARKSDMKGVERYTFRNGDNPFKNLIRTPEFYSKTVAAAIEDPEFVRELVPVVIRNYLRNSGFLHSKPLTPEQFFSGLAQKLAA